ncbi:D-alanyl-D-alanine carboxypeptidase/D-alanyl-D-alanine-endopeptidase [Haliea sp. E17]|uniref:D-alanyl-D-alanine carboxypeptidase/D-alanyl-D-alanine endopeptidase n=1 Tax=Haliea sp. E17 TaxID=3401576 RepID=UPI003AAD87E3
MLSGAPALYAGNWSDDIIDYATKSLENPQALSLAAVPLDGPGTAQYVNADFPMKPGSIMKLVTTYAALELLGPGYTWDTDILTDGKLEGETLKGNLYVRFGGDPKLSIERLWALLSELRGMGISKVAGDLVLDGSYFRLPAGQPRFDDNGDNPWAPFLVEPSAYLSNFNLQQIHLQADQRGIRAWAFPDLPQVSLDNQVKTAASAPCPRADDLVWKPAFAGDGAVTLTVSGQMPRDCRVSTYLSLLPPEQFSAALLRTLLAELGIAVAGADRFATTPENAEELLRTTSPDLVTMVRDINKWSSNVMARQLLLSIGAAKRADDEQDDRRTGVREILDWMQGKGIDTAGLVLENGSGLSREGRMSAQQGVALLQHAWDSPYAPDLMSSMPIIAIDGTMRKRLKNTELEGRGRIKTGSLDHVRSIAGFTRDNNNTTWAVVAIVNNDPAWNGQAVLDRVLYSLYYHPPAATAVSQVDNAAGEIPSR